MTMEANAESLAQTKGPPKRRLRNYLLDRRFQLKYTGAVVLVTVLVGGVLGYFAYDYSRGQTQALSIQMMDQPDLDAEAMSSIMAQAEARDRQVLYSIVGGIVILAIALGLTGIVVTHRVVGPAYKLRRLLGEVAEGKLHVEGRLRRGDELQEVFEAFARMLESLRSKQATEVSELDAALERAREAGVSEEQLEPIRSVRDKMQRELE
jgi:methyl-accepting chemotaxis protein